jgi:hypothetical protein
MWSDQFSVQAVYGSRSKGFAFGIGVTKGSEREIGWT